MTASPAGATPAADERLLAALMEADGCLEGEHGDVVRIVGGRRLRRLRIDPDRLARLIAAGLVEAASGGRSRRLCLTPAGRARLARAKPPAAVSPAVAVGTASPLARLARLKDRDGRPYLSPEHLAAGERLAADVTRAHMMPTVTSNWSILTTGPTAARGPGGGLADLSDRALAARARVERALVAVGPDLADLLLDVCGFHKGLEQVEVERRWPVRSAKVVLDIALARLAAHYGLGAEARGPDRSRLRAWGSGDHRPTPHRPAEPPS